MGHEHQAAAVRDFVHNSGGRLPAIRSDTGSGYGAESLERRPDLQEALRDARKSGAILVVSNLSRLARDLRVLETMGPNLPRIWCLKLGREASRQDLIEGIQRAQEQAELIQVQTANAVQRARRAGKKLGSPDLAPAQRAGCIANGLRAETKVQRLAGILAENPDWLNLSRPALAENLNAIGHWNIRSERTGEHVPWTPGSLRKPLARARELLQLLEEINAEEFDLTVPGTTIIASQPSISSLEQDLGAQEPRDNITKQAGDDLDDDCFADILNDLYESGEIPWDEPPRVWRGQFGSIAASSFAAPPTSPCVSPAPDTVEAPTGSRAQEGLIYSDGWFFGDTGPVNDQSEVSTASRLPDDPDDAFSRWDYAPQEADDLAPDAPFANTFPASRNAAALIWQEPPPHEIEHVPKQGLRVASHLYTRIADRCQHKAPAPEVVRASGKFQQRFRRSMSQMGRTSSLCRCNEIIPARFWRCSFGGVAQRVGQSLR